MSAKPLIAVFLCILGCALILPSPAYAAQDLSELVKQVSPSVFMVEIYDAHRKPVKIGTGFFINSVGDFVTNHHVLANGFQAYIKTADGGRHKVSTVVAGNPDWDLVVAHAEGLSGPVRSLNISKRRIPDTGSYIAVIGNPTGLERTVSDGIISSVRDFPKRGTVIQITAPISGGSSGSPVMTLSGDVIGVVTSTRPTGQNLNFAIPASRITQLTPVAKPYTVWSLGIDESTYLRFQEAEDKGRQIAASNVMPLEQRWRLASYWFRQALVINPNDYNIHYLVGMYTFWGGDTETGKAELFKAIEMKPDFSSPYLVLTQIYYRQNDLASVFGILRRGLSMVPDDHFLHMELGEAYAYIGRLDMANDQYLWLLQAKSELADNLLQIITNPETRAYSLKRKVTGEF